VSRFSVHPGPVARSPCAPFALVAELRGCLMQGRRSSQPRGLTDTLNPLIYLARLPGKVDAHAALVLGFLPLGVMLKHHGDVDVGWR
jgi:hypothetical protein